MADNIYQLAGKVNVPAEKKDEMNTYVLEIMDKCGIRKTEKMTVAGTEVIVVSPEFLFLKGIYRARKKQFKIGTSININIKRECFSGNNYFPRSILFLYITLESLYKVSNTQSWKEKNYLLTTNCALLIADSVCVSNNTLMLLSRLL